MTEIEVKVRNTYSTYIAKVVGKPLQASCTAGEEHAVQRLAEKFYGSKATVERVERKPGTTLIQAFDNMPLQDRITRGITHIIRVP